MHVFFILLFSRLFEGGVPTYLCPHWSSGSVVAVLHRNFCFCCETKTISLIAVDNRGKFSSATHPVSTPANNKMHIKYCPHRMCVAHWLTSSPAQAIIRIVNDVSVDGSNMSTKFSFVAGFKHKRHILLMFASWLPLSSFEPIVARFVAITFFSAPTNSTTAQYSQRTTTVFRFLFKICNFRFDRRIYYLQFSFSTYWNVRW